MRSFMMPFGNVAAHKRLAGCLSMAVPLKSSGDDADIEMVLLICSGPANDELMPKFNRRQRRTGYTCVAIGLFVA